MPTTCDCRLEESCNALHRLRKGRLPSMDALLRLVGGRHEVGQEALEDFDPCEQSTSSPGASASRCAVGGRSTRRLRHQTAASCEPSADDWRRSIFEDDQIFHCIMRRMPAGRLNRMRAVCGSWQRRIDAAVREGTLEEPGRDARIFIADRRRAILERFVTTGERENSAQTTGSGAASSSSSDESTTKTHGPVSGPAADNNNANLGATRKSTSISLRTRLDSRRSRFLEDQYAHRLVASWAFRFDLARWTEKHDVAEVCLQNFGAFLQSESSAAPTAVRSSSHSLHHIETGAGVQEERGWSAYDQLPSTQMQLDQTSVWPVEWVPGGGLQRRLVDLSAGRIEQLAAQLAQVQPLHLVFKDHASYPNRPTMLLFWFIRLLQGTNTQHEARLAAGHFDWKTSESKGRGASSSSTTTSLRRLTFDGVQAQGDGAQVKLTQLVDVSILQELTVRQPANGKPAILVDDSIWETLLAMPNASAPGARRLRLRLFGRHDGITAAGLYRFVKSWQQSRAPLAFDSIVIDSASIQPWDFVREAEREARLPPVARLGPPPQAIPFSANESARRTAEEEAQSRRQLLFRHGREPACIRYRFTDRLLVLSWDGSECGRTERRRTRLSSVWTPPLRAVYSHQHHAAHNARHQWALSSSAGDRHHAHQQQQQQLAHEQSCQQHPSVCSLGVCSASLPSSLPRNSASSPGLTIVPPAGHHHHGTHSPPHSSSSSEGRPAALLLPPAPLYANVYGLDWWLPDSQRPSQLFEVEAPPLPTAPSVLTRIFGFLLRSNA